MAISEDIIAEIKYRNDIETVISGYVDLKRAGKNLKGLCPFHNEKTPSFTVYPDTGSFYCYGCHVGGDVFTFTKLIENLDYVEAIKFLADKSGIVIPEDSDYDDSISKLKKKILEINRETAKFYHGFLLSDKGKWALDYLYGRGLSLKTINHFGLGAAPDNWDSLTKHLRSLGYSDSDLLQANVVSKSSKGTYYDRFRNRVMFPIIDIRGNVVGFSGRQNPDDTKSQGKYVNTADTLVYKKSNNLFAFNFAKNNCAERVILVEGNMDVISLHQAGFENAVAALGTAFTDEQAKLLTRYTKEIVLCFDADNAGQNAMAKAMGILKKTGLIVRILRIPDGKDPDEFINKNSADAFRKLLENAKGSTEYQLITAADNVDKSSDLGRIEYIKKVSEILSKTSDALTVDYYVSKLADEFKINKATLYSEIDKLKKKNYNENKRKEINAFVHPKFSSNEVNRQKKNNRRAVSAEENIISVLLKHTDLFKTASDKLNEESFVTDLNRRVFSELSRVIEQGNTPDISFFAEKFSDSEIGYIVKLQNETVTLENAAGILSDSIRVLSEEKLKNSLSTSENATDEEWEEQIKKIIDSKKGE